MYVTTCIPNKPNVIPKVRKMLYRNLQTSNILCKTFRKHKLIGREKQSPNLRTFLCPSNLLTSKPTLETTKCGKKLLLWRTCPRV